MICKTCGGTRLIDSGAETPWGAPVKMSCPDCDDRTLYRIHLVTMNSQENSSVSQDVTESITQLVFMSNAHVPQDMLDFIDGQIQRNLARMAAAQHRVEPTAAGGSTSGNNSESVGG